MLPADQTVTDTVARGRPEHTAGRVQEETRWDTTPTLCYSRPGAASCVAGRAAWPQAWRRTWSVRGQGPWAGGVVPPGRSAASCWSAAAAGSWSPRGGSLPRGAAWGWSCHCHLAGKLSTTVIVGTSSTMGKPNHNEASFFLKLWEAFLTMRHQEQHSRETLLIPFHYIRQTTSNYFIMPPTPPKKPTINKFTGM